MSKTTAIQKMINIGLNEVGYLEKATLNSLYSKTANAGYNNYTKYWADIASWGQGQPWCACFVTWVFQQAFGKDKTKQLLKHYPFISCPKISELFKLNANPEVGDIVIFYRNGVFAHTGIVTGVKGDYFTTVEGNTSAGSEIVPNGGGVYQKGYYNSNLPGTKFCRPDWSIVDEPEVTFTETATALNGIITATELNVRALPSTDAEIIAKHKKGDQVTICAKTSNGWYKVNYPFGIGYISASYVGVSPIEDLTQDEFNSLMNNYLGTLGSYEPDEWSKLARNYCESKGIIQGDEHGWKKYKMPLTREELANILYSLHKENLI